LGNDFALYGKGGKHAELISIVHGFLNRDIPLDDVKAANAFFDGNIKSIKASIEAAKEITLNVGVLNGRLWGGKDIISFWAPKEVVDKHLPLISAFLSKINVNIRDLKFDYATDAEIKKKLSLQRDV
jgi:hypothetical protein